MRKFALHITSAFCLGVFLSHEAFAGKTISCNFDSTDSYSTSNSSYPVNCTMSTSDYENITNGTTIMTSNNEEDEDSKMYLGIPNATSTEAVSETISVYCYDSHTELDFAPTEVQFYIDESDAKFKSVASNDYQRVQMTFTNSDEYNSRTVYFAYINCYNAYLAANQGIEADDHETPPSQCTWLEDCKDSTGPLTKGVPYQKSDNCAMPAGATNQVGYVPNPIPLGCSSS